MSDCSMFIISGSISSSKALRAELLQDCKNAHTSEKSFEHLETSKFAPRYALKTAQADPTDAIAQNNEDILMAYSLMLSLRQKHKLLDVQWLPNSQNCLC